MALFNLKKMDYLKMHNTETFYLSLARCCLKNVKNYGTRITMSGLWNSFIIYFFWTYFWNLRFNPQEGSRIVRRPTDGTHLLIITPFYIWNPPLASYNYYFWKYHCIEIFSIWQWTELNISQTSWNFSCVAFWWFLWTAFSPYLNLIDIRFWQINRI